MSDSHYSVSNEDNKTELETASTEQTTSNEQTNPTMQTDTALKTTIYTIKGIDFKMILVEAGTFTMDQIIQMLPSANLLPTKLL